MKKYKRCSFSQLYQRYRVITVISFAFLIMLATITNSSNLKSCLTTYHKVLRKSKLYIYHPQWNLSSCGGDSYYRSEVIIHKLIPHTILVNDPAEANMFYIQHDFTVIKYNKKLFGNFTQS